jgi:hypothetical protein
MGATALVNGGALQTGGRVIGFIGNCQTELLHRGFQHVVPAGEIRSFYHFYDVADEDRTAAAAELAQCDELLVQDIQNFEHYTLRDCIPRRTNVIRFPFLWFAAPWPYDDFNGLRDNHARGQDDPSRHTTTYYDGALGKLRKLVPDPRARFEAYRQLDVPALVRPDRILDFETRRLEGVDARFGMTIGRRILEAFRHQQLFYTVNRPCGSLLLMLLDYILVTLNLGRASSALPVLDELRSIQAPIHPKVATALGMSWADESRVYQVHDRPMNWETYVRDYIERYS